MDYTPLRCKNAAMPERRPAQKPEGELIARAMVRRNMSARAAAPQADMSEARWRQIVNGYQRVAGQELPVTAPAATLARMARAVGVTPEELENTGRSDAAHILRDLNTEAARQPRTYTDIEAELNDIISNPDRSAPLRAWAEAQLDQLAKIRAVNQAELDAEHRQAS
jgi:hypothetical protein